MNVWKWVLTVLFSFTLFGQQKESSCVLETGRNGDLVQIRAEAFPGGHDMFIRPIGCAATPANRVVLVWADDLLSANGDTVRKDAAFAEFKRLLKATLPLRPDTFGVGQSRYRVVANFEGRLEVARSAGLVHDPRSKKAVGLEGFGHPLPFARFRLVATGVLQIESEERRPRLAVD